MLKGLVQETSVSDVRASYSTVKVGVVKSGKQAPDCIQNPFNYTLFFIRTLCFWWGSNFLKLSPFKPYFFLFFFLILCVLRLNFLKFFLNFWCSKAIFSYFFKYFMEICYPGLENWPRIVKILPILYYYAFLVYFWPKTYTI